MYKIKMDIYGRYDVELKAVNVSYISYNLIFIKSSRVSVLSPHLLC